jgi:hypothetical protein
MFSETASRLQPAFPDESAKVTVLKGMDRQAGSAVMGLPTSPMAVPLR